MMNNGFDFVLMWHLEKNLDDKGRYQLTPMRRRR
jgi:hypothetical protein